jgi:hypothetical protein
MPKAKDYVLQACQTGQLPDYEANPWACLAEPAQGGKAYAMARYPNEAEAQQFLDDNAHLDYQLSIKYDPCGFHG